MIDLARTQKRVAGMSERQLLDWLDVALSGMQRHLDLYNTTRNPDHLGELVMAETTANIVVTELMIKTYDRPVENNTEPFPAPSAPSGPRTDTGTTSAPRRFIRPRRRGRAPATNEDTGDLYWYRGKEPVYVVILRDQGQG